MKSAGPDHSFEFHMLRFTKIALIALLAIVSHQPLAASSESSAKIHSGDVWYYRGSIETKPPQISSCVGLPCERWCNEDACAHGKGFLNTDGGEIYEGSFEHGLFHGFGEYQNDFIDYKGGFKNGKFHGHGVLTCPIVLENQLISNIRQYEGAFIDGKMNGEFTVTDSDSTKYMIYFQYFEFNILGWPPCPPLSE